MKINYTIFFSIILATGIVAAGFTFFQVSNERARINKEMITRSSLVSEEFIKAMTIYNSNGNDMELNRTANLLCRRYRLLGIALYVNVDSIIYSTPSVRSYLQNSNDDILSAVTSDSLIGKYFKAGSLHLFQYIRPVNEEKITSKAIVVYTEAGFVHRSIMNIWFRNIIRWLIQAILVALITVLIIRYSIFTPLNNMVKWMK